jgi:hypothetical protein
MSTASIDLHRLAGEIRAVPRTSMIAAAKAVKTIAEEEGRPPFRKRKRAIKLRAFDKITESSSGGTQCLIQGAPVGLWSIRTSGARAHQIPKARRGKKARYLALPDHPVRTPPVVVHHPGSRGNGAWLKVQARAAKVVPAIFADGVARVVRSG